MARTDRQGNVYTTVYVAAWDVEKDVKVGNVYRDTVGTMSGLEWVAKPAKRNADKRRFATRREAVAYLTD